MPFENMKSVLVHQNLLWYFTIIINVDIFIYSAKRMSVTVLLIIAKN